VNIILTALGSAGDVHPLVGIGARLKQWGHRVTILTSPYFAPLVERAGLELVPLGTVEEFQTAMNHPLLWHPRKGIRVVMETGVLRSLPMIYEAILERYVPGETVVGAHSLDFASRTAQEKLGVPVATIHLAPSVFRTLYECPYLPPLYLPNWLPKPLKSAQFRFADWMIDRLLAGGINDLRRKANLPPVSRVMNQWWFSPQRVIGLFPEWFGPQQPDWPKQTRLVGFPLWDEREITAPLPELTEFLAAGDPPVVFTPGSAMSRGHLFFRIAIEACQRLGRRAILLTKQKGQIPEQLPAGIKHFDFVPFSLLLPRSAALVHHGGIGTLSQAISAGIPHLVMPMAFDQPDNARRLVQLGVARSIPQPQFSVERVVPALQSLLASQSVAERCQRLSERMRGNDGIGRAAELIVALNAPAQGNGPRAAT
jgi:rhamnosyltransferase subunit B